MNTRTILLLRAGRSTSVPFSTLSTDSLILVPSSPAAAAAAVAAAAAAAVCITLLDFPVDDLFLTAGLPSPLVTGASEMKAAALIAFPALLNEPDDLFLSSGTGRPSDVPLVVISGAGVAAAAAFTALDALLFLLLPVFSPALGGFLSFAPLFFDI